MIVKNVFIEGTELAVAIAGFKSRKPLEKEFVISKIKEVVNENEWLIILPETKLIPDIRNILVAVTYAYRAFLGRRNISRWFEIEVLLYLLGDRNVKKVLEMVFPSKSFNKLVSIAISLGNDPREILRRFSEALKLVEEQSLLEFNEVDAKKLVEKLGLEREVLDVMLGKTLREKVSKYLLLKASLLALS